MKKFVVLAALLILTSAAFWLDSDIRTRGLIITTCELSLAVIAGAVPCGVLLAFLITRTDVSGRRIANAILTTMLFMPLYLQAAGWDAGFGRQGWLTLSRETSSQPLLVGMVAAIWIHTLGAIPWVVFLVGLGLRHIDPELEESAQLECCLPAVVWRVTLPLALPAIMAAAVWVFIVTASEMTVTDLYQVRTLSEEIYVTVPLLDDSLGENGGGATLPRGTSGLLGLVLLGLLAAGSFWQQPRSSSPREPLEFRMGIWRLPAAGLLTVAIVLIAGIPFVNLAYNAGVRVEEMNRQLVRGWSLAKASWMVAQSPARFADELTWSIIIASVTATVSLTIAAPLAWCARHGGWRRWLTLLCVATGAALPGPLVGLWIIRLLNQPDFPWLTWLYDHSVLAPVAATVLRALPAAILVSWYGFQSLSADLLDAAAVDGLGPADRFLRLVVPIRWRVLAAAWLVSFVLAVGDLTSSVLVTPPGLFTIPVRVFGLLHAGVDDQVAGLCLANACAMVFIQLALVRLLREREKG